MMGKLFQTQCLRFSLLLIVCATTLCTGCGDRSYSSPEGYDLRRPRKMDLGKVLNEISGLTFYRDSSILLAIADSKKKVIAINPKTRKLHDVVKDFAEQADFEDLVLLGDTVYVLVSNGTIMAVPLGAKDSSTTRVYPFWSEEKKNDFETLYYDADVKGLIMICKSCVADKGEQVRSAFRFDMETRSFDTTAFYRLSTEDVKKELKNDEADFKPSAAAIHPVSKRLYILASAGNLLVIADTKGTIIKAYNLNPDQHPQAEGIAFAPNGDMYISNEGKYGTPTLQHFPYRQVKKINRQ
jgi:uncharacterized protein YjiK